MATRLRPPPVAPRVCPPLAFRLADLQVSFLAAFVLLAADLFFRFRRCSSAATRSFWPRFFRCSCSHFLLNSVIFSIFYYYLGSRAGIIFFIVLLECSELFKKGGSPPTVDVFTPISISRCFVDFDRLISKFVYGFPGENTLNK